MKKKYMIAVAAVVVVLIAVVVLGVALSPKQSAYDYVRKNPVWEADAFLTESFLYEKLYEDDDIALLFYKNKADGVSCAVLQKNGSSYEYLANGAPILPEDATTHRKITFPNSEYLQDLAWGIVTDTAVTGVKLGDVSCEFVQTEDPSLRIYFLWNADTTEEPEFIKD